MRISILTPSLNSVAYLERAIQSVLAQNDPNFEHIIVDGGSTDGTVTILKRYPHLKWVSEPDQGQTDAMNKAFSMSQGDITTYLNADDWFEPGVFAHVRDCFAGEPEADMVIGNFYSRYAENTAVRLVVPVKDYRSTLLFFRYDWPLNPVCYFYRRSVQASMGEIPADVGYGRDYWFVIWAMAKSRIHCSDLVFGTYFFHPGSETVRKSGTQEGELRFRQWVRQHLQETNPQLLMWWNVHWCWHNYVRAFPVRIKAPFKYLAYKALFASKLDYEEYNTLGFRHSYRRCFRRE
jgi:glycosyltransferase involved in cell wall biosynthesis